MRKVVTNASPLVFATKVPGILELLREMYDKFLVPNAVYEEIVERGLESEKEHVKENTKRLEKVIEQDDFVRMNVEVKKQRKGLGKGENAAIELSKSEKVQEILIDERKDVQIAKSQGLKPVPLPAVLIKAFKNARISKKKCKNLLDKLLVENYWLSTAEYRKIIQMLEEK